MAQNSTFVSTLGAGLDWTQKPVLSVPLPLHPVGQQGGHTICQLTYPPTMQLRVPTAERSPDTSSSLCFYSNTNGWLRTFNVQSLLHFQHRELEVWGDALLEAGG